MAIEIVKATMQHIPQIREVAWKGWYPFYLQIISEGQIRYMYRASYSAESLMEQMHNGHRFLLLMHHGTPAVMASFGLFDQANYTWRLHKLYSDPLFQGKGHGKAMLQEVCRQVKEEGGKVLQLNVNRNNPTFKFYLQNGFQVVFQEDLPFGPYWMNDYRMEKIL